MNHNSTAIVESSALFKVIKIVKVKENKRPSILNHVLKEIEKKQSRRVCFLFLYFPWLLGTSAMFHRYGLSQCLSFFFFPLFLFSGKPMEISFAIRKLLTANKYCGDSQWDIFPFGVKLIPVILCKY